MTVRDKMREFRKERQLTLRIMSDRSGVSETLLGMVENGNVTHPKIVKQIQDAYQLSDLEAEELMPKNYRPRGGDYDPDRYKPPELSFTDKVMPARKELIDVYIEEHQDKAVRLHQKRGVY